MNRNFWFFSYRTTMSASTSWQQKLLYMFGFALWRVSVVGMIVYEAGSVSTMVAIVLNMEFLLGLGI